MRIITGFTFLLAAIQLQAQQLLPSIGQFSPPNSMDAICSFPVSIDVSGTFEHPGPEVGDTVPDFTLYDMANNAFTLSDDLHKGKYVLLISGSYTCPAFRDKINKINSIVQNYLSQVSTYVVYELEAHPYQDTSVYFGYVNPGAANLNAGILYNQPDTYGERKDIISDMNKNHTILAPILIDGPCNEYLGYFGPAPTNAYLIDTNGIVAVKHGWFDNYPHNMKNDLDSILSGSTGNNNGTGGSFTFTLDDDSTTTGMAGDILTLKGVFTNPHLTDDVIIDIQRQINNMPDQSWSSAMCINVCLSSAVSQYTLQIPPNSSQLFTFYFFTGSVGSGDATLVFTNQNNAANTTTQKFYGHTQPTGIPGPGMEEDHILYPNPTHNILMIKTAKRSVEKLVVYSIQGKLLLDKEIQGNHKLDISALPKGVYFIRIGNIGQVRKLIIN